MNWSGECKLSGTSKIDGHHIFKYLQPTDSTFKPSWYISSNYRAEVNKEMLLKWEVIIYAFIIGLDRGKPGSQKLNK